MRLTERIHELTIGQNLLEIVRKAYMTVNPSSRRSGQYSNHSMYEGKQSYGQEVIKSFLQQDKPCMLARFGATELHAYTNWLQVNNKLVGEFSFKKSKYIKDECPANWFSLGTIHGMELLSGFFPPNKTNLQKWGEIVEEDLKEVDLLFSWQEAEKYICDYLNGIPRVFCPEMYKPYRFKNPWTAELRDKKILVVSPFSETIESQYNNKREKLFSNPDVLPEFDLCTIKAFNTIGGFNPYQEIKSWFDALGIMKSEMNQIDYDVALLGCGSYAFELAAHAKRQGKKAITMCGSLQVLFGVYGARYEKELREQGILNEYWVRPSPKETPKGYKMVENGAYW